MDGNSAKTKQVYTKIHTHGLNHGIMT